MKQHLDLLGFRVRDKVTGFEGVVTSISFDLYGCIQAVVNPSPGKDGKLADSHWFDTKRLEKLGRKPVMALPTFETISGGQHKPPLAHQPAQ